MQVEGGLGRVGVQGRGVSRGGRGVGLWEGVQPDEGSGNGVHAGRDHPELISGKMLCYTATSCWMQCPSFSSPPGGWMCNGTDLCPRNVLNSI